MRCGEIRATGATIAFLLIASTPLPAESLLLVHEQRYAMGTMFDIVVYHGSRAEAEQAIGKATDEIVRLDQVLSHFKTDSDLSGLMRTGRHQRVTVDSSLYDVLQQSLAVSRASGGRFDVTIAPLLRVWKAAREQARSPSASDIADAQRCVGYEKIDASAPGRIRLRSPCLEIDLGGIGKGYAADRALAILKAAGIRHAVVNAGGSSIGSAGTPPAGGGWPVRLGTGPDRSRTLWLRDAFMSTSEQSGEILDPETGAPPPSSLVVTVIGPSGTVADALSTTLVLLSIDDGRMVLDRFPGTSALWMTDGEVRAVHGQVPPCR
jgi:thiamine biosynthesis lipoprotein